MIFWKIRWIKTNRGIADYPNLHPTKQVDYQTGELSFHTLRLAYNLIFSDENEFFLHLFIDNTYNL